MEELIKPKTQCINYKIGLVICGVVLLIVLIYIFTRKTKQTCSDPNYCKNGGICYDNQCSCIKPYSGKKCDVKLLYTTSFVNSTITKYNIKFIDQIENTSTYFPFIDTVPSRWKLQVITDTKDSNTFYPICFLNSTNTETPLLYNTAYNITPFIQNTGKPEPTIATVVNTYLSSDSSHQGCTGGRYIQSSQNNTFMAYDNAYFYLSKEKNFTTHENIVSTSNVLLYIMVNGIKYILQPYRPNECGDDSIMNFIEFSPTDTYDYCSFD